MEIKVLLENTSKNPEYLTEHGLCLYIKTKYHQLLFDSGQSDAFLSNAKQLNVDISDIDIVFLSHGHYDHCGGLKAFLSVNHHAKVYINSNGFSDFYKQKDDGKLVYIGLDKELKNHNQIVLVNGDYVLDEELEIMTDITQNHELPSMNKTLLKKIRTAHEDLYEADDFSHEQNLIIHEDNKHVLIAGCAHQGIMNIMDSFHHKNGNFPYVVLSGFHLSNDRSGFIENSETLQTINDYFKNTDSLFYTGHCTGIRPYEFFYKNLGDQMQYMYTGRIINI